MGGKMQPLNDVERVDTEMFGERGRRRGLTIDCRYSRKRKFSKEVGSAEWVLERIGEGFYFFFECLICYVEMLSCPL